MLNQRQKAQLQALANPLAPIGQIGKAGLSEQLLIWLGDALELHELIKLRVLKTCPLANNEISIELTRLLHCDLVQSIGSVIVLYRPSKEHKRIKLVK